MLHLASKDELGQLVGWLGGWVGGWGLIDLGAVSQLRERMRSLFLAPKI